MSTCKYVITKFATVPTKSWCTKNYIFRLPTVCRNPLFLTWDFQASKNIFFFVWQQQQFRWDGACFHAFIPLVSAICDCWNTNEHSCESRSLPLAVFSLQCWWSGSLSLPTHGLQRSREQRKANTHTQTHTSIITNETYAEVQEVRNVSCVLTSP